MSPVDCPRCGARLPGAASECPGCGLPTIFMASEDGLTTTDPVLEPEVLESLDEADRTRSGAVPPPQHAGCTLGPGCGCIGLPLAVLAGVVVSSLTALLWVLSLGRAPISLARLAALVGRGFRRS